VNSVPKSFVVPAEDLERYAIFLQVHEIYEKVGRVLRTFFATPPDPAVDVTNICEKVNLN